MCIIVICMEFVDWQHFRGYDVFNL